MYFFVIDDKKPLATDSFHNTLQKSKLKLKLTLRFFLYDVVNLQIVCVLKCSKNDFSLFSKNPLLFEIFLFKFISLFNKCLSSSSDN